MKGLSVNDPIKCNGPLGEQKYIEALRCPSGRAYTYNRTGSIPVQKSEKKILMIDEYSLKCGCGKHSLTLYFDMYHGELMKKLQGLTHE